MILIDTSTVVAWLDQAHPDHKTATRAIVDALMDDEVAVSVVTLAELTTENNPLFPVEVPMENEPLAKV